MDDPNQLKKFIRQKIVDGHDQETTFRNLYQHFNGSKLNMTPSKLKYWLARVKSDNFTSIPDKFHLAFGIINSEFKKTERAIETRQAFNEFNRRTFIILTSRYAIELQKLHGGLRKLHLLDMFHGQKRLADF